MSAWRPKYITFDCYGTLIDFRIADATRERLAHTLDEPDMARLVADFVAYRRDEVLGDWKPYAQVIHDALERACRRNAVDFRPEDARAIYDRIPSWGPHPDVPKALAALSREFPLVILSNAADAQIGANVATLGAPFHAVFTAEQARAYKPRLRAFEYMLDRLGCGPQDVLHCSSSFRYDLMPAHDLGICHKVWVNRGHEPANPGYGYVEIKDVSGLPAVVGL